MSEKFNNSIVEYESGKTVVKLSPNIIRNYLVSGGGKVSDQEIVMFLNLCKAQRLNPFLREAYLIKYGNSPATMVTGKDVFTKRASMHPLFAGYKAGVIVSNQDEIVHRNGSFTLPEDILIGGWCRVFLKGYETTIDAEVSFNEYCQKKTDGTPSSTWAKLPATMIRKVAVVQALREAFPTELQGLYDAAEMPVQEALNEKPIYIEPEIQEEDIDETEVTEVQPEQLPDEPQEVA